MVGFNKDWRLLPYDYKLLPIHVQLGIILEIHFWVVYFVGQGYKRIACFQLSFLSLDLFDYYKPVRKIAWGKKINTNNPLTASKNYSTIITGQCIIT